MTAELTGRSRPRKRQGTDLTPEESTLVVRLSGFVTMRWIATASVLIASLLATQVFNINFSLLPIYFICAVLVVYNIMLFFQARGLRAEASGSITQSQTVSLRRLLTIPKATSPLIDKVRAIGNLHIILDLLVLAALIHFTGGIENPFIFFFTFHVIIAGILLHHRVAYFTATSAILLVLLLVGLEYNGVIPHVHLAGFATVNLYRQGTYILGVLVALTACLYASAYMVTHLSGELRKRQREVDQ